MNQIYSLYYSTTTITPAKGQSPMPLTLECLHQKDYWLNPNHENPHHRRQRLRRPKPLRTTEEHPRRQGPQLRRHSSGSNREDNNGYDWEIYGMGKVIYVNGSIIISTNFFVPKELGCGYQTAPQDAVIVEPMDEIDSFKCLLIDDQHPQSLFNEYYAKEEVSTGFIATSYFTATYLDCISIYNNRISETCGVIHKVEDWPNREKELVYKMSYVNVLTSLDAFLCHVLLKRCKEDERLFKAFMFKLAPNTKKERWNKLMDDGKEGEWEQDAIKFVLESSFINTEKVDELIKMVGLKRLEYERSIMNEHFRVRHLIVHRSGRQRDDNEINVTSDSLKELINDCNALVGAVRDSLYLTIKEENKAKPKLPDIEDVFPGGVVKAPFKLSDLARLLRGNTVKTEIDPFEMPSL